MTSELSNSENDKRLVNQATFVKTYSDAYKVTWLVRRLFRAMTAMADEYLRDAGLSAADRAVMESLFPHESRTVPAIARHYEVSRQHIQATTNRLLDQGLLRCEDNPRHKRSPLLRLSRSGREVFRELRRREGALLDEVFADVEIADIAVTRRTLEKILAKVR